MSEFAKYYVEFLWLMLQNVWFFIRDIGLAFYNIVIGDAIEYVQLLAANVGGFDVFGWILLIIVSVLHIVLSFFIAYRVFQLIRRYFITRRGEIEKDKLLEEVARLHEQSDKLVKEKEQIFSLKVGAKPATDFDAGTPVTRSGAETQVASSAAQDSRFTKLINLDEKYKLNPHTIYMDEADMLPLSGIVKRFVNFAASQLHLYYTEDTVRLYFAAMATSKIIILEGISGTGKTSLPYAMGKFFTSNTFIVSVQPSWRDRAELIGYFNEFTKKFNETDFLSGLYECTLREDPNFIVLDEMNLARIEYYFADFLSIMEMPDVAEWKIDLIAAPSPTDPQNVVYGKLLVPQNVWFVGTANNDDSTFTITDKVYDRAVAIALNTKADYFDAPMTDSYTCTAGYLQMLFDNAHKAFSISEKNFALLKELDEFIQVNFKISFGNRIMKQLRLFVPAYMGCGGTELDGIDFIVTTKILRKFTSLNLPFLTKELAALLNFLDKKFGKGKMKMATEFIKDLQKLS
ncbi:MAG TPA: hypothetical protein DDW54_03980 [Clostridiales bacterium]|nr:hypothetical protein [Clostridiales bacterium]